MLSTTTTAAMAVGQNEDLLRSQLTEFLRCYGEFQQSGSQGMDVNAQYQCGALMSTLQQELNQIYYSGSTYTYSPDVVDMMFQAAYIIKGHLLPPGTTTGYSSQPGLQTVDPSVFSNPYSPSTPSYNSQLGTERQCTELGYCGDIVGGGPGGYSPSTGEFGNLPGSGDIPAGSDIVPTFPDE